jgi:RNA polymerase sigma factor (TIGR02999 family)
VANVTAQASEPITKLLERWRNGDASAADALLPMVYAQLRAIARRQLAGERAGHSLMPTDLVHEAYLKLSDGPPDSASRIHFFAIAARAMRQVLVDHERHRRAGKRDGGERVTLSSADAADPNQNIDLLALDQALHALERVDARKARVIELRTFAGLDFDEIAQVMDISRATLARDFRTARAWLYRALDMTQRDAAT